MMIGFLQTRKGEQEQVGFLMLSLGSLSEKKDIWCDLASIPGSGRSPLFCDTGRMQDPERDRYHPDLLASN
ncbi:MAG: hypothetical protein CL912_34315 [Deltaproteobacteria bacterium]|nr:hypothetical protein [Deltaproteobacteria bacterium]